MRLLEIKEDIPEKLYNSLDQQKLDEFRPCQEKALINGLLTRENLVVCSPTASGKTLVAEIGAIKSILERKGKAIYICPLKSLATEKHKEFKEKYPFIKTAVSIGDLDASDPWLAEYDLVITTSEKMDSLIRHGAPWISHISTIIIDEIHLLNDSSRGPTLEILITILRNLLPEVQIIGLSATIGNPRELANWLDANLVEDEWRPVDLHEGIFNEDKIDFFLEKSPIQIYETVDDPTIKLALDTIKNKKQALVFCPSKPSAEATAEKISKRTKLNTPKLGEKALKALSSPTKQCKRLSGCVSKGIAFHHAGLVQKQKELVEENFKKGNIKVICCTPTLAAGVNLPAFRAIMRSLKRYSKNWGQAWIPVLEYRQMTGRAGRPGMEEYGEAICIAKSEDEKKEIYEKYVIGKVEDIFSKLAVEPVLRTAILSLIATGFTTNYDSIIKFFGNSFYGFQYDDQYTLESKIIKVLDMLIKNNFIREKNNKFFATLLGKRISELYLDPESAQHIIEGLEIAMKKDIRSISFLQLVSDTVEMRPIRASNRDWEFLQEELIRYEEYLLLNKISEWDIDYESFLDSFKNSLLLQEWIEEFSEDEILEKFKIRPGEVHNKISNANWMLYAAQEIARILEFKDIISDIRKTRVRIRYGIKEELLPIIKIKGVGRIRARKLFNAGLDSLAKLRKTDEFTLARYVGSKTAAKIREELEN